MYMLILRNFAVTFFVIANAGIENKFKVLLLHIYRYPMTIDRFSENKLIKFMKMQENTYDV